MKLTLTGITSWLVGLLMILLGIAAIGTTIGGAVVLLIIGLFTLPTVRRRVTDSTGIEFSRWLVVGIVVVGAGTGMALISANVDTIEQSSTSETTDEGQTTASTAPAEEGSSEESTGTSESYTHQVGESFIVGSGENQVEYTVTDVATADSVGEFAPTEADGRFVIVELDVTNRAQESFTIDSALFTLRDGQGRTYNTDDDAQISLEESIIFEQVDPEVEKSGKLVFDVPTDQSDRNLIIEPAGIFSDAEEHEVVLST